MHGVWVYPFTAALRHPVGLAELQNESGTTSHMSGACLMVDDIWNFRLRKPITQHPERHGLPSILLGCSPAVTCCFAELAVGNPEFGGMGTDRIKTVTKAAGLQSGTRRAGQPCRAFPSAP
ncbi:hypothetical protein K438DRAFT_1758626 [Mycena galopus ATCC 62051]|nr:hypothetical protein K438DRAFT_1758626 [Mycena galopus ATCC 62051]